MAWLYDTELGEEVCMLKAGANVEIGCNGAEWESQIMQRLNSAQIILLQISAVFVHSDIHRLRYSSDYTPHYWV